MIKKIKGIIEVIKHYTISDKYYLGSFMIQEEFGIKCMTGVFVNTTPAIALIQVNKDYEGKASIMSWMPIKQEEADSVVSTIHNFSKDLS